MVARHALIIAAVTVLAAGIRVTPVPVKTEAKAVVTAHNSSVAKNVTVAVSKVEHVKKNLTEDEQVSQLENGLQAIKKLQGVFTGGDTSHQDLKVFAEGAMTTEMSRKDSTVWSAIESMLGATKQVMNQMKNASKVDKKKIMDGLEKTLDAKATDLKTITDKATEENDKHSAEYLLGLLNQHSKDWNMSQQLVTAKQFVNSSMAAFELVAKHNDKQPLAVQLAAIMDDIKNTTVKAKAKANTTLKAKTTVKANATVSAAKKAAKQFIQLVDSIRLNRA